jgi:hypothetical protein
MVSYLLHARLSCIHNICLFLVANSIDSSQAAGLNELAGATRLGVQALVVEQLLSQPCYGAMVHTHTALMSSASKPVVMAGPHGDLDSMEQRVRQLAATAEQHATLNMASALRLAMVRAPQLRVAQFSMQIS